MVVRPLTADAFAPYGMVLERPASAPHIDKGWLGYWHALAPLAFPHNPVWGFLEVRRRDAVLRELERHRAAPEVFIPAGGVSVMPFATGGDPADADARPDPATMQCFLLDGTRSVIVNRGVWHAPAFPITETAAFLLALEEATPKDDIDTRAVAPRRLLL